MEDQHAERGRRGEDEHGPGLLEEQRTDRQRQRRDDESGHEALRDVEQDDRTPVPRPERAPDVRRTDVPAADGPDVDALRPADDPVPEREAAGQIAEEDEGGRLDDYFSGMPYPETQLLTVAQSRFWKNASMYAARSVR